MLTSISIMRFKNYHEKALDINLAVIGRRQKKFHIIFFLLPLEFLSFLCQPVSGFNFSSHFSFSVVVVIAFFFCWMPFHSQRLIFSYIEHQALNENFSFIINSISGVLFFVSTCINPFLYNIMRWRIHLLTFHLHLSRINKKKT